MTDLQKRIKSHQLFRASGILVIVLIFFANNSDAQLDWNSCLGSVGHEHFNEIIELNDGSLISVGDISPTAGANYNADPTQNAWVVKHKPNGDTLWTKSFGGSDTDRAHGVIELDDCNILVCGYTNSMDGDITSNQGFGDAWLFMLDPNGNLLWSETYGGSQFDFFNGLYQDVNDDIFVIGSTYSNDGDVIGHNGLGDYWFLKIDDFGNILSSHCYGGTGNENGFEIIEASNNNLLIGGYSNSTNGHAIGNHGMSDFLILKLDKVTGNVIWSNCYGGTQNDNLEKNTMLKLDDNLFGLAGSSRSNNGNLTNNYGGYDYVYLNIDSLGNLINVNHYGGSDDEYCTSMILSPDSSLLLFGQSRSNDIDIVNPQGNFDYWLVKIDQNGNLLNSESAGTANSDHGRKILNTFDFGFILAGFSYGNMCNGNINSAGGKDWNIIKFNHEFDQYNDSIVSNFFTVGICPNDSVLFGNDYLLAPGYYYSTVNNSPNCDSVEFIHIEPIVVDISIGNDTSLCEGDTYIIDPGNLIADYLWQDGSTSPTLSVSSSGTYSVSITLNNCTIEDSIFVEFNSFPTVDLGADTIFCMNDTLFLNASTTNSTYLWSNNSTSSSIQVSESGQYWVQLYTAGCGFTSDTINIVEQLLPEIHLGNDTVFCHGEIITLDMTTPNATYLWQDNSSDSVFNVSQEGVYWGEIMVNSCTKIDSIYIGIEDCQNENDCNEIFVPSAFSPNDDNSNDVQCVYGSCITSLNFMIYNRWGELVFESKDLQSCWDGKYKGEPLGSAVFYYVLTATLQSGEQITDKGNISLIR